MKYLSLLLASSVFFCYTGVCYAFYTTPNPKVTKTSCQTTHHNKVSNADANAYSYYNNPDSGNNQIGMCQDALLSAHNGYDLNLKDILLYSLVVKVPSLEINKVFNSRLNFEIKKQYRPPDLFLLNSSFLL
jgi:hypothetical protein